jgi:hypothetical protein
MSTAASRTVRLAALAVGLLALGSLMLQLAADLAERPGAGVSGALWTMARYFTNLTNAIVAGFYIAVAVRGRWPGAGWPAAVTVWIVAVGAVYHALLAATHDPEGLGVLSNIGMHTLVPLGVLALWLAAAPKDPLRYRGPLVWTLWPLGYAGYALLRGTFDGVFPYFFLDPGKLGIGGLLAYVAALGIFFMAAGALLVVTGRRIGSRHGT